MTVSLLRKIDFSAVIQKDKSILNIYDARGQNKQILRPELSILQAKSFLMSSDRLLKNCMIYI